MNEIFSYHTYLMILKDVVYSSKCNEYKQSYTIIRHLGKGFHVWVVGPQQLEASPKWVKPRELRNILFICTEMGGV